MHTPAYEVVNPHFTCTILSVEILYLGQLMGTCRAELTQLRMHLDAVEDSCLVDPGWRGFQGTKGGGKGGLFEFGLVGLGLLGS